MFMDYPHSLTKDLVTVEKLPYNFYKVTVKYGFKDEPDLPKDLALCVKNGVNIDPMNSSYFIGKEILLATPKDNMNYWRKKLFIGLFRSAETITNQFKLPPNRVVELGSQVLF
jgi:KUP system potassium uptake protein